VEPFEGRCPTIILGFDVDVSANVGMDVGEDMDAGAGAVAVADAIAVVNAVAVAVVIAGALGDEFAFRSVPYAVTSLVGDGDTARVLSVGMGEDATRVLTMVGGAGG